MIKHVNEMEMEVAKLRNKNEKQSNITREVINKLEIERNRIIMAGHVIKLEENNY